MQAQGAATRRVALLIDGENVSNAFAGRLILEAAGHGALTVKRVYGSVGKIPGWESVPGFAFHHAGPGKNAADILLAVDAMGIFHKGLADIFVLASSDGDFRHLATRLREEGAQVFGAGEGKAPEAFRKSCTHWIALGPSDVHEPSDPHERIRGIFSQQAEGLLISQVNPVIKGKLGLGLTHVDAKTWRKYFESRPSDYIISGQGPQTRIALAKSAGT